jgi:hypothetical protein
MISDFRFSADPFICYLVGYDTAQLKYSYPENGESIFFRNVPPSILYGFVT